MKYVKTNDGCITKGNFELGKTILTVWGEETITKENSANTIEELIDTYIVIPENGNTYTECKKWDIYDYKEIYGAIWTTGEHEEPILKSIAKMNNDGELELL